MTAKTYGGIEAGGTKFVCAIGTGPDALKWKTQFATTTPDETIGKAVAFFQDHMRTQPLAAIGISSFGPLDLDKNSPSYGYITMTPKASWSNTDFTLRIQRELGVPVVIDTDVNGAALGEQTWGAARDLDTFLYLTVGTGFGGGGMANGRLMHGLVHPEMGHIRVPHDWEKDPYPGSCPYHGDCLEGLVCGRAMELRWGRLPETIPPEHPAWELEAHYLALAINNFICTLSPQRIIVGGGLMKHAGLLPLIQSKVAQLLNEYIRAEAVMNTISSYIVPPALGDLAGVLGALALAMKENEAF